MQFVVVVHVVEAIRIIVIIIIIVVVVDVVVVVVVFIYQAAPFDWMQEHNIPPESWRFKVIPWSETWKNVYSGRQWQPGYCMRIMDAVHNHGYCNF